MLELFCSRLMITAMQLLIYLWIKVASSRIEQLKWDLMYQWGAVRRVIFMLVGVRVYGWRCSWLLKWQGTFLNKLSCPRPLFLSMIFDSPESERWTIWRTKTRDWAVEKFSILHETHIHLDTSSRTICQNCLSPFYMLIGYCYGRCTASITALTACPSPSFVSELSFSFDNFAPGLNSRTRYFNANMMRLVKRRSPSW